MKNLKFVFLSSAILAGGMTLTACGGGDTPVTPTGKFNFVLMFESGRTTKLYKDDDETIEIFEYNAGDEVREYTPSYIDGVVKNKAGQIVTFNAEDYIEVTKSKVENPETHKMETIFTVLPKKVTTEKVDGESVTFEVGVGVTTKGARGKSLNFTISERFPAANTGYNFASDTEKKEEILGKLEEYAMKNYLTGITLFENGGYVRYSKRVHLPTEPANEYITGYGFGLLTEGYLDDSWTPTNDEGLDADHLKYLQSATSSDPGNIAGWNAQGSQVSDLYGYITSSYFGTRLAYDDQKEKYVYEWFPVLAQKVLNTQTNAYDPIPMDGKPTDTIHKKYRIYVKTNELAYNYMPEANADGSAQAGAEFHRRKVKLEDYLTTFQVLLTQSTNLFRGAEFAADDSYGLKGAYSYFGKTKGASDEVAETFWENMQTNGKLGVSGGHDDEKNMDYLDFEFKNPIDTFTAKYTLSSNLYSPIPKDFLKKIGDGGSWIDGAQKFGTGAGSGKILSRTLCLGPYYLESWISDQATDFKRDDEWFEIKTPENPNMPRYRIPGVHLRVVSQATQLDYAIYNEFKKGKFDSTGIPASIFKKEKIDSDLKAEGDATFKLNVNSLDQEKWDEMFVEGKDIHGKYKKITKKSTEANKYHVKKWMHNKHFLNGLFWSIDRNEFAKDRGVTPSTNYFSDAYLSDPINGESYNKTKAHYDAQDAFDPYLYETCGYDSAKATSEFNLAVTEMLSKGEIKLGTQTNPTFLDITIDWMYSTDPGTYGNDIVNYFDETFNKDNKVSDGLVKLRVTQQYGSDWQQVYDDHLQNGHFDLGFGAISGNTLSPLNFMEVLKSDNSSGFTLNWGVDTSIVDPDDPIVFEVKEDDPDNPGEKISVKKEWSYDAAWATADHGSIVVDGSSVDSVDFGYTEAPTLGDDKVNRLVNGAIMNCPFEFVKIGKGASFEVTRIEIAMVGAGSLSIDLKDSEEKKWIEVIKEGDVVKAIKINFDNTEIYDEEENLTFAEWINNQMYVGLHNEQKIKQLDPVKDKDLIEDLENPFSYEFYGIYWWIEVYYNITIEGSVPTENSYSIRMLESDRSLSGFALAK